MAYTLMDCHRQNSKAFSLVAEAICPKPESLPIKKLAFFKMAALSTIVKYPHKSITFPLKLFLKIFE